MSKQAKLISTAVAAERMGVSQRRVQALIAAGRLTKHPINERCYLVDQAEVDALERKPGKPRGGKVTR